jgi:hypothetical protein
LRSQDGRSISGRWIALQAAATVWVLNLVLRVHGFGKRPFALLGTVALLAIATSLPWLVDMLITDIFAGLSVLALHSRSRPGLTSCLSCPSLFSHVTIISRTAR